MSGKQAKTLVMAIRVTQVRIPVMLTNQSSNVTN